MPKEPKPNLTSFTKAELVKTVKKLDARQTKLLNRIAELEGQIAASIAQPATYKPGPYDVVRVTQGPDTVSELVPPFCPLCDVNTKPPNCEVPGCPNAAPNLLRPARVPPAFPWED